MKERKIIIFIALTLVLFLNLCIAFKAAVLNPRSDISAFYYAANVVLDSEIPNDKIYDVDVMRSISANYGIYHYPMPFVYSVASAFMMSPIVLLPYEIAGVVFNLINILMYMGAVIIILLLGRVTKLYLLGSLAVLALWMPFLYSQYWLQSNALLVFLIALSVYAAARGRPLTSGLLIGLASLFKLYPLAFAVYLGFKNWRITASCIAVFSASFLLPGSLKWFTAIQNIHPYGSSPIKTPFFAWLSHAGSLWCIIYALIIMGITALVFYQYRGIGYPLIMSFAIPAVFLINPYVDYHHLTMLVLSYTYILARIELFPRWFLVASIMSFIFINAHIFYFPDINPISPFVMIGVFLLWVSLILFFHSKEITRQSVQNT